MVERAAHNGLVAGSIPVVRTTFRKGERDMVAVICGKPKKNVVQFPKNAEMLLKRVLKKIREKGDKK